MKQYLCIDIDSGVFRYGIVTEELDVLDTGRVTFPIISKDELFEPLADICEQYEDDVEGVSITMPGVIDEKKGMAYSGGVFQWVRNMEYAREVSEMVNMPVAIYNDAKAAALAEIGYGSLKGIRNGFMVMILGGGIGGALVTDGHLLDGAHYAAGEFSYIRGDYKERDGDLAMFARSNGIDGLTRCVEEETGVKNMNIIRIMSRIQSKDEDVLRGVNKYCDRLATYIYNIQCITDASRVVIGGNITDDPTFLKLIKEAVHRRFVNVPYLNIWEPEIVESDFHSNARMFGAVYNFRRLIEHVED